MPSTIIPESFPYDIINRGRQDSERHGKRVKDAARKQLKDIISQQDIITSEGNKKVKVKLKYLDQYRFIYNRDKSGDIGRDEFDELAEGEVLHRPTPGQGKGKKATNESGDVIYETEFTIDELTEMMIEDFKLPDLEQKNRNEIVSDVIEWTDRRKGSGIEACIDKKKTILSHILRKKKMRRKNTPIIKDDLQYRTWQVRTEKHSNAVIFLLLDRSGSMVEEKIYIVKALYFWIVQFLRSRYTNVEIKFIAHDYDARELSESEFFSISDSGGTRISAAYEMCRDMIKFNYPKDMWNIYAFHASDGDSWNDEKECVSLVEEMIKLGASMFAYSEVRLGPQTGPQPEKSTLYTMLEDLMKYNSAVLVSMMQSSTDVVSTLRKFLQHSHRRKLEQVAV